MTVFPPEHFLGAERNGTNHVSMNLGAFDRAGGPKRGEEYPIYADALLDWYLDKGIRSVRLMVTWEAVQSRLGGSVPPGPSGSGYADYWHDLTDVLVRLRARGIAVILCPWQYNPASGDTDVTYDGASFTAADFAAFWGSFATAVNGVTGADQQVAFDLINEPHTHAESGERPGDVGISAADWFAAAQAAITKIRDAQATNTILVPGMAYTAAESFVSGGSAARWLDLTDPAANLAVTVHCYAGLGATSPTVLPDACVDVVTWAGTHGVRVHVGEIALDAGRPTGTWAAAQAQWTAWTQFCADHRDVLIGWNWWANSAGGWFDDGDSEHGKHWSLTTDDGQHQTVYMDLIETTLRRR